MIIAAIEAGGTKFVLGVYRTGGDGLPFLLSKTSIPTTSPEETLAASADFLEAMARTHGKPEALGIGSFGPVDLRPSSPGWGHITATPKPGWQNTDLAGYFRRRLALPVAFDTDVNAAAYGEYLWGRAKGLQDFVYITVGTGVGGGLFSGGNLVHGLSHPELGHIRPKRFDDDPFPGVCPFHGDCLEGLASGPAIAGRWGAKAEDLPPEHPAWDLEARILARAFATFALVASPEIILLGGGVGLRPGLAEKVSLLVGKELAGYIPAMAAPGRIEGFVARPSLGGEAGLAGSAALALRLCTE